MSKYPINEVPSDLEPWPFEGEASGYKILRGNPQASGRFDLGSGDSRHRLGIWSCTEGAFECTERGDELQTIIINPATIYIAFSHRVPAHGKASERRCSHSPASFDNAARGQAHDGLSF